MAGNPTWRNRDAHPSKKGHENQLLGWLKKKLSIGHRKLTSKANRCDLEKHRNAVFSDKLQSARALLLPLPAELGASLEHKSQNADGRKQGPMSTYQTSFCGCGNPFPGTTHVSQLVGKGEALLWLTTKRGERNVEGAGGGGKKWNLAREIDLNLFRAPNVPPDQKHGYGPGCNFCNCLASSLTMAVVRYTSLRVPMRDHPPQKKQTRE